MDGLELTLLCGFLGSGKTTLLTDHLRGGAARDTAVIVNEVGQIDVDGAVIAAGASVPTVMLSNGCVCCSIVNELSSTIEQLFADRVARGEPPLRRIVVECSGLSTPGPILRSLARLPVKALQARVVSTFDVQRGADWLRLHREAASQLAAAHTVVFTKLDLASAPQRTLALQAVASVNPLARVVDEADAAQRAHLAFPARGEALAEAGIHAVDGPEDAAAGLSLMHGAVRTWWVRFGAETAWDDVASWLDDLTDLCGERLLRLKGFVKPADEPRPLLLQSVGTVFSAPRPVRSEDMRDEGLVLITRDLGAEELQALGSGCVSSIRPAGRPGVFA